MKIENFISYEQPTNYIVHSDQYTKDGQIPVLTAGQSFVLGYTDEEDGIYTGEPVVIFDDFTTSVQYVDFPFKVKSSAMKILKNKQNANIKFCYYLLSWLQKMPPNHKRQWISTTSQIDVNLPPIEWQKKIVQKIESVSNIIKYRKEELKKLDELVSARFVEMFGDPKINEKRWDSGIISDYYEVKGGKRIPKGMGYSCEVTTHPYLRATDMKNETIIDDDIHYIDDEVYEHIKRYTVKGGDIYLTNVGVNLGMAGVIPNKYDGANLTENAVKLVPKTDRVIDSRFLAHYINSPGIQEYINERKMSVGVPKLAIFRIETMPLLVPPMDIQIQFVKFCLQVDKSKVAVKKALDETQLLFDSLMQKYFG